MSVPIKITASPLYFYLKKNDELSHYKFIKSFSSSFGAESEQVFHQQMSLHQTQSFTDWFSLSFLSGKFAALFQSMKQTASNTSDTLAKMKALLDKMLDMAPDLADLVRSLRFLANTATTMTFLCDVCLFFLTIYYRSEWALIVLAGAKLALSFNTPSGKQLVQKVMSSFYSAGKFIIETVDDIITHFTQAAPTTTGPISSFVAFVRSLIGLQIFDDQQTTQIISKMRAQIGMFKDIKTVWTFAKSVLEDIAKFFGYTSGHEPIADISKFLTECEEDMVKLGRAQLLAQYGKNPSLAKSIREKHAKLNGLRQLMSSLRTSDPDTYKRYTDILISYSGAMLYAESFDDSHKQRSTPPIIHFKGKPGVGKSVLVRILAAHLHRYMNKVPPETPISDYECMYVVNPNDAFHDAYRSQTVYYYDDPNQHLSTDVLVPFLQELIAIGQDTPYQLTMAGVENKAAGFFNSPFVFFSTNGDIEKILNLCANHIQDLDAIRRRITIEVEVKRSASTGSLSDWSFEVTRKGKTVSTNFFGLRNEIIRIQKQMADTTSDLNQLKTFDGKINIEESIFDLPLIVHVAQGPESKEEEDDVPVVIPIPVSIKPVLPVRKSLNQIDQENSDKWHLAIRQKISSDTFFSKLWDRFGFVRPPIKSDGEFDLSSSNEVKCLRIPLGPFDETWVMATVHLDNLHYLRKYWGASYFTFGSSQAISLAIATSDQPAVTYYMRHISFMTISWLYVSEVVSTALQFAFLWLGFYLVVIGVFLFVDGLIMYMIGDKYEDPVAQLQYPKENATHIQTKVAPVKIQKLEHVAQGGDNTNVVASSIRQLAWVNKNGETVRKACIQALAPKEGFLVFPHHFLHFHSSEVYALRVFNYHNHEINQYAADQKLFDCMVQIDADLVMLNLGRLISPARNIVTHFMTDDQISSLSTESGIMLTAALVKRGTERVTIREHCAGKMTFSTNVHAYGVVVGEVDYVLDKHIKFDFPTKSGQCGFPYLIPDKFPASSVLGMHISGDRRAGCGIVISRETLEKSFSYFQSVAQGPDSASIARCDSSEDVPRVVLPGRAKFLKVLPKHLAAFMPTKPAVQRNEDFFDTLTDSSFPEIRIPSMLKPTNVNGVRIDPLQVAVSKIGDNDVPQDQEATVAFDKVAEVYRSMWPHSSKSVAPLSEQATLNGLGPSFKAITPKKSAGVNQIPSVLRGKYSFLKCIVCGESDKCACTMKNWVLDEAFRKSVQEIDDAIARDAPESELMIVFNDTLKSELRKSERVLAGQSRLFSVGPFELLFLTRKYFGPFMDAFNENFDKFSSGIGLNPHSPDWKNLHDRLMKHRKALFADAKNWDANMRFRNIMKIHEEINVWFALERKRQISLGMTGIEDDVSFERSQRIRIGIAKRTYRSIHLIANVLYLVDGNPSGQGLTGIINTLYNNVSTRAAIILHFPAVSPTAVFSLCQLSATGDDIVLTHDLDYTCQQHADSIARLGIILTPADKSAKFSVSHYSIYEGDYLKRKFRPQDGLIFAPLDKLSVLGMCNYKSPTLSDKAAARAISECLQIELMHYGKEYFDEITEKYRLKYASLYQEVLPIYHYHDLVSKFLTGSLSMDFVAQSGKEDRSIDRMAQAANVKTAHKVVSSKGAYKSRYQDRKNSNAVRARLHEGKSFNDPVKTKMNANHANTLKLPHKPSIPFDAEKYYGEKKKAQQTSYVPPSLRTQRDTKIEAKSALSDLDMVMSDWSDKPVPMDKTGFVSKNRQKQIIETTQKKNNVAVVASPHIPPEINVPVEPLVEKPLLEKEFPNSFKTQTMPSSNQSHNISQEKSPIQKFPKTKVNVSSNLKRAYRPSVPNDPQATGLLRYLNVGFYVFQDILAKYNVRAYRHEQTFKDTAVHYAQNNLSKICAKNHLSIVSSSVPVPETKVLFTKLDVTFPSGEVITAYGIDRDAKNQRKFACLNMLYALVERGISVPDHFLLGSKHIAQSGYEGEKAPIDDALQQLQNVVVQEDTTLATGNPKTEALSFYKNVDPYLDMTPKNLLERQILIGSFPIASTSAAGSLIIDLPFPETAFTYYSTLLNRFGFFMADFCIESRLNANMSQQGLLVWSFIPLKVNRKGHYLTAPMQVIQHVALAQSVSIDVPALCYNSGFSTITPTAEEQYQTGNLLCHIVSPIREANVSATVSVLMTVYLSLKNPKAYGFKTQSGYVKDLPKAMLEKALPPVAVNIAESARKQSNVSAALDSVSDIASTISVIPQAAPFASSVSVLSKLAASVTRLFGHSNSRSVSPTEPVAPRSIPPMSTHHGVRDVDTMGLSVDSSIATDEQPSTIDYTLYDNFKLIPFQLDPISVGKSTALGTIATIPLGPQYIQKVVGAFTHHSPAAVLADGHRYYRGGQKFALVFVCNRFCSFRLRVYWKPPRDPSVPTATQVSNYANRIINVNGPTMATFSIPYLGFQPFLSTVTDVDEFNANGSLVLELLTTPQLLGTVDVPAQIVVYTTVSESTVFAVPQDFSFVAQSGMEDNLDMVSLFRTTFAGIIDAQEMTLDKVNMSDIPSSFRERYSKPIYLTTITLACSSGVSPTPTDINLNTLPSFPSLEIRRLFNTFGAYKGGLVFHFIPRTLSVEAGFRFSVTFVRGKGTSANLTMRPFSYSDPKTRYAVSVLVPEFNPALFRAPGHPQTYRDTNVLSVRGYIDAGTQNTEVDVLVSLAEDFTLFAYNGINPSAV
jgi:hypothetical protein